MWHDLTSATFCLPKSKKQTVVFLQFQDVLMVECETTLLLYLINSTKSVHAHTNTHMPAEAEGRQENKQQHY